VIETSEVKLDSAVKPNNLITTTHNTSFTPQSSTLTQPVADSGATHTVIKKTDAHMLTQIQQGQTTHAVMPNGSHITSNSHGVLKLPGLRGHKAQIYEDKDLGRSLISLSEIANAGATVVLDSHGMQIYQDNNRVYTSTKAPTDRLWTIPEQTKSTDVAEATSLGNVITHQVDADLVDFYHSVFGRPSVSSFKAAIAKGYLSGIPQLTLTKVTKNLPQSVPTSLGHLDRQRKNVRSTKTKNTVSPKGERTKGERNKGAQQVQADLEATDVDPQLYSSLYADATGKLPVTSKEGSNYILVFTFQGHISYVPMKDRTSESFITAYKKAIEFYRKQGHVIGIMRLDNETSNELENYFRHEAKIDYQLSPPTNHRANTAERAIRTAKNHLIAILANADPSSPAYLWESYLEQAQTTLNHLLPYKPNPTISAYLGIHQQPFDFSKHPLAPCGAKVVIFESPEQRKSWAQHGVLGYYLGPAMEHYRCYKAYAIGTRSYRVTDTLEIFTASVKLPGSSIGEIILRN
jgi:acetone carboxylase gamma subunit